MTRIPFSQFRPKSRASRSYVNPGLCWELFGPMLAPLGALGRHVGSSWRFYVASCRQDVATCCQDGPSCRNIAIFVPNMAPKSSKNRWKIDAKIGLGNFSLSGPIFHRFFIDLGPPCTWKNSKNDGGLFVFHVFGTSSSRQILKDFVVVLVSILLQFWLPKPP